MKKSLLAIFFLGILAASPAYARGGVVVKADRIMKIGDFPEIELLHTEKGYIKPGWCYKTYEVVFIPVWNTEGRYCGYISDEYYNDKLGRSELLKLAIATGSSTDWANKPPTLPWWDLFGGKLIIGGLILAGIIGKLLKK